MTPAPLLWRILGGSRPRCAPSLVFWTLGTGIGSGIIVNDMMIQGEHSCGSEVRAHHHRYGWRPHLCYRAVGTLESYASAPIVDGPLPRGIGRGRESSLRERQAQGEELTPLVIGNAAEHGDALALTHHGNRPLCWASARCPSCTPSIPPMFLIGGDMTFGAETPLGRRFSGSRR